MSRHDDEWLGDFFDASQAIRDDRDQGDPSDGMTFNAIRLGWQS